MTFWQRLGIVAMVVGVCYYTTGVVREVSVGAVLGVICVAVGASLVLWKVKEDDDADNIVP